MNKNRKGASKGPGKIVWRILTGFCLAVFICSVAGLGTTLWNARKEDDSFRQLADIARSDPRKELLTSISVEGSVPTAVETVQSNNYAPIYEMNHDFVAWLRIDDTKIDYPVMSTPNDPQYYIRRDFYGNQSVSGTLFLGDHCNTESQSVIIYGHNMKNGTMFGSLTNYASESYWRAHPVITFDTIKENRQYEVIAAFQTRLFYEGEAGFRYHEYCGDLKETEFNDFISQVKYAALYSTGVEVEYGDRLLMLSTCSYHEENGRFVVVARYAKDH